MKNYLFLITIFVFVQIAESEDYNKMFIFDYKILKASEVNKLFESKKDDLATKSTYDNTFYILGSVKLSSEANFPSAMVEIKLFDSKRKSLNCTYKLGWVGSANATFFLIRLWNSQTMPEIKYNFNVLMQK